jgi:type IV pilus assembly protein PilQ
MRLLVWVLVLAGVLLGAAEGEAMPVSINAADCEVRDILFAIARQGNVNLLIDDSVCGKVNIRLENVEFSDALQLIAAVKGLKYEKAGERTYLVGKELGGEKEPCVIFLQNLGKEQAIADARAILGMAASDEKLAFDETAHALLFYGTRREAEQLKSGLKELDVVPRQVVLEAKVLALENSASKKLGIDWEWPSFPQKDSSDSDNPSNEIKVRHDFSLYYRGKLDALITDGKAKVLAKPNILALDGQEAEINIGGSVPVPTVTSTNTATTTTLEYHDVGIILKYTPHIGADDFLRSKVHIEVSSPVYVEEMSAYKFNKRSADTNVYLKDGEVMVIGGLIGKEESDSFSRLPFLGDLPVLGKFFSHRDKSRSDSEIVIFLTANVVK